MIKLGKYFLIKFAYIFIDVFILSTSIYLTCLIRQSTLPFPVSFNNLFIDSLNNYHYVFLFWIVITVFINNNYGLYETKREIFESTEIWEVFKAVFLSSFVTIVAIYLAKIEDFPRSVIILVAITIVFFFSLWRIGKRMFVGYIVARGYNNFNTVIIGAGKVGTALAYEIKRKPELGIRVIGYLDDFKTTKDMKDGIPVLGKISDFPKVARREFINNVFVTIHHDSKVFLELIQQAKDRGIAARVIPQGFEFITTDFIKYNIGFIPILEYLNVVDQRKQAGKRIFDFGLSLFLLVVLAPFFVVLAVMVKLDSPGPIFYASRRYGRGGRIFKMWKFRSMVEHAEKKLDELKHKNEVDGPIFKMKEDPRITRFGKFLRRYSLDELPQIFNVFIGEMSLVGPRPFPIEQIEKEDLDQLTRLEVRPGITGLWQIKGRSDLNFSKLLKLDIWYIDNWSFWLDLTILFQTLPVVIKGRGAY